MEDPPAMAQRLPSQAVYNLTPHPRLLPQVDCILVAEIATMRQNTAICTICAIEGTFHASQSNAFPTLLFRLV